MSLTLFLLLCEISLVSCALVAGVFLTFSDFVMKSLNGARASAGIEVMQGINRDVFKTVFMVLLIGMWPVSAGLGAYAHLYTIENGGPAVIAAAIIYSLGVMGVTLVFNVPMNNRLAEKSSDSPEGETYWSGIYYPRWTFWNWVRALASGAVAVCYLTACLQIAQG